MLKCMQFSMYLLLHQLRNIVESTGWDMMRCVFFFLVRKKYELGIDSYFQPRICSTRALAEPKTMKELGFTQAATRIDHLTRGA